jgi:hypothetical protein
MARTPTDEHEVIMYGVTLWPCIDEQLPYTYDQLATATFHFDELRRMAQFHNNPLAARGRHIRHASKWLAQFVWQLPDSPARISLRRVFELVNRLTRLMEQNPDGHCLLPLRPNLDVGATSARPHAHTRGAVNTIKPRPSAKPISTAKPQVAKAASATTTKPKPGVNTTKPKKPRSADRHRAPNRDRHRPGYMADYMRRRRAAKRKGR